jgi:hypothetical protein
VLALPEPWNWEPGPFPFPLFRPAFPGGSRISLRSKTTMDNTVSVSAFPGGSRISLRSKTTMDNTVSVSAFQSHAIKGDEK